MEDKFTYKQHQEKKRKCPFWDHTNNDWVSCAHTDNPTVIKVCSAEHCPIT